jgi:hypothetical protein
MSGRIFKELDREIKDNLIEFDKLKSKITPESKKEMKKLDQLRKSMERLKKLPTQLGIGVMITFALYFVSILTDSSWFFISNPNAVYGIVISFMVATGAFFVVGIVAIIMVLVPMHNEFEAITKKQKSETEKRINY